MIISPCTPWHFTVYANQITPSSRHYRCLWSDACACACLCLLMHFHTHLHAGLGRAVVGDSNRNHSHIGDRWFFDKVGDISQPLTTMARLNWHTNTYWLAFTEQLTQQLKNREKWGKDMDICTYLVTVMQLILQLRFLQCISKIYGL